MWRGEKVDLRPVTTSDLVQLEEWTNDPDYRGEFNRFGLQATNQRARSFAETGLLTDERGTLLVQLHDGAVIGFVSYHHVRHGSGESNRIFQIGIALSPAHRGHGYGVAAQREIATYLFATYPIERVEAETDVENIAEQRALERAGFRQEGTLRHAQWRSGRWHDLFLYSKLRSE